MNAGQTSLSLKTASVCANMLLVLVKITHQQLVSSDVSTNNKWAIVTQFTAQHILPTNSTWLRVRPPNGWSMMVKQSPPEKQW